jgi:glutamyl-tRNA synthetase
VTLGDPTEAVAWMAASLGLAEPGERPAAADLVDRFDPAALPREPTMLDPAGKAKGPGV